MLKRKVTTQLICAIIFTIFLPVGIYLIIFGATNGASIGKILLGIGIAMAVLGFYGCPMWWVNFGENKAKLNLLNQITIDNVQQISELATNNNQNVDTTLKSVKDLISKRYLTGYEIVNDEYVVPKTNKTLSKDEILEKSGDVKVDVCSGCGAPIEIIGTNRPYCQYCGRRYGKK